MDIADVPGLVENPPDRCYICKRALFARMEQEARARGFDVILDGTNATTWATTARGCAPSRAGRAEPAQGAGLYQGVHPPPLRRARPAHGGKARAGVPGHAHSFGTRLDAETMRRIDEAETRLMALGFAQVRVRAHGGVARIEVPKDRIRGRGARAGGGRGGPRLRIRLCGPGPGRV